LELGLSRSCEPSGMFGWNLLCEMDHAKTSRILGWNWKNQRVTENSRLE